MQNRASRRRLCVAPRGITPEVVTRVSLFQVAGAEVSSGEAVPDPAPRFSLSDNQAGCRLLYYLCVTAVVVFNIDSVKDGSSNQRGNKGFHY